MVKSIIFIVFILVVFMFWMRYFEWRCLFIPMKEFTYTPKTIGLEHEDVFLKTKDSLKINAWFIPANTSSASNKNFTLLFCHGNGGNISHRISKIKMLNKCGLNIFIYDYRGYGKSQGRPYESGIYLDTQAAYDYLSKERGISPDSIIAYGESLGGAVAINLAARSKLKALVLEGVFTNTHDIAKEIFPFLPTFLVHNKFDSLSKIKNINCPKLFIHSSNDEIVPIELSKKLYNAAPEPKIFITIEGSHNTCIVDSENKIKESITSFIDEL